MQKFSFGGHCSRAPCRYVADHWSTTSTTLTTLTTLTTVAKRRSHSQKFRREPLTPRKFTEVTPLRFLVVEINKQEGEWNMASTMGFLHLKTSYHL